MINILFVCHGNICRSPMAEFVLKDMVDRLGLSLEFNIQSCATSTEEIGSPVHYGTRNILNNLGISVDGKHSVQLKQSDYDKYDYIIGMDSLNMRNIKRILECEENDIKLYKLLEFTGSENDVADPWYTGDFNTTYRDIFKGCIGLLESLNIDCIEINKVTKK